MSITTFTELSLLLALVIYLWCRLLAWWERESG